MLCVQDKEIPPLETEQLDQAGVGIANEAAENGFTGFEFRFGGIRLQSLTSKDAEMLVGDIARRIARDGCAALIIDYGHAARAPGETLQAVRRHRFDDVLAQPGLADLTAHVDFGAVAEAAHTAGGHTHGPVAQGVFLDRLGLGVRMQLLCDAAPDRAENIRAGCRRLSDPGEMGELFKALAITRPGSSPPAGFEPEGARPC